MVHDPGESPTSLEANKKYMEISPNTSPEAKSRDESSKAMEAKEDTVEAAMDISPQKAELAIVQAEADLEDPGAGHEDNFLARLIHDLLKAEENVAKVRSSLSHHPALGVNEKRDSNDKISVLEKQLEESRKVSASRKNYMCKQYEVIGVLAQLKCDLQAKVRTLNGDLLQADAKTNDLNSAVMTLQGDLHRAEAEIKNLKGAVMTMNGDLHQTMMDLDQANVTIIRLQREVGLLTTELMHVNEQTNARDAAIVILNQNLAQANARIDELQEEVVVLTADLLQANMDINERDATIGILNQNLAVLQAINALNQPEEVEALDPPEDVADDHSEVIDQDGSPQAIDGPHVA